jgi:hypothetical protein
MPPPNVCRVPMPRARESLLHTRRVHNESKTLRNTRDTRAQETPVKAR